MDENQLRAYVRQKIKDGFGSLQKFADAKGINAQFVSFALTGRKRIPKAWLEEFGIEVVYQPKR